MHHIKHHHKKYLFGVFGGFAVVKLFALVLWLSVVEYTNTSTFAQLASGCMLTGQYYTGESQTWGYLTGQELTWWTLADCTTIPWYWTWGSLDESGVLTWQTWIDDIQTGCVLTWQTLTSWYMTWYYLTWGYWTGGYITWCLTNTGTTQTGNTQQQTGVLSWTGVCESWDIIWNLPFSWSVVRNIFPITWAYSWVDCLSGLLLQLRDHNSQRITLTTIAPWITWYLFDSKSLYSFQQSWFYHIIWTGTSGQIYLYTGIATWTYTRLFSGYKLRLLTLNQTPVYETMPFTINNQTSILTWITLLSSWSATWYLTISGVVILNFTASQPLTWLQVTLWWNKFPTTSSVSGLLYTYTWMLSSWYTEGPLAASISFVDSLWTTGIVIYTWSLIFDTTLPILNWFVFTSYTGWVAFNFSWSEPIRYTISYWKVGWGSISGSSAVYLTGQQFNFSWIEIAQTYLFTMNVYDRAGNSRSVTGDVLQTTLWTILSHVYIVPLATTIQTAAVTWNLSTLAVVLKAEVEKFNMCKNALSYTPIQLDVRGNKFVLQMPMFQKSQVKTLVNAFTLFVLDKIKNNAGITSDEITEITKKFDSFLIVLKLLRDDDNVCKQNLSNYHISQFKKVLEEFNISL